ncbi:MAG: DUF3127 domain-containing protein [Bacteroidota bacterium]|nr:DUF3127 domain-containing protein [Bacteroidota bacterium]MDX5428499.1 DUF3127 domain-containing protein [Bacteroidota bacterium]MDX5449361.1 DUF3127 domain-containing protein [Bacteroidota bacterium]MDX5506256.1 DUF3127 domain-containing protein [Bacteroidota bacterium]
MELTGTVKEIFETKDITPSFRKREMVLTTEEQYPQQVLIEFVQDKTDELDRVQKGQRVTVGINIRGREWTSPQGETKYFNSIQGWRIQADSPAEQGPSSQAPEMPTPPESSFASSDFDDQEDDLPF